MVKLATQTRPRRYHPSAPPATGQSEGEPPRSDTSDCGPCCCCCLFVFVFGGAVAGLGYLFWHAI